MRTQVGDLFASLGVKVDDADLTKLSDFTKRMQGAARAIRAVTKAMAGLNAAKIPEGAAIFVNGGGGGGPGGGGHSLGAIGGRHGPPSWPFYQLQREQKAAEKAKAREAAKAAKDAAREENRVRPFQGPPSWPFYALQKEKRGEEAKEQREQSVFARKRIQQGSQLARALLGVGSLVGVVAMAVKAMKDIAASGAAAARSLDRLNAETGMTAEEAAKWKRLGQVSGVGQEAIFGTIGNIQKAREEARWGKPWAGYALPRGGIDLIGNSDTDVLKEFMAKTEGVSPAERFMWADRLGISRDMIYALQKYGDELDKTDSSVYASSEDVAKIRAMTTEWSKLSAAVGELSTKSLADVSGFLKSLAEFITPIVENLSRSSGARANLAGTAMQFASGTSWMPGLGAQAKFLGHLMSTAAVRPGEAPPIHQTATVNISGAGNPEAVGEATARWLNRTAARRPPYTR